MSATSARLHVLAGGLTAGAIDMAYACAFWGLKAGVPPTRIFQSVAAGLLGQQSFSGGAATAVLGLVLHFFIATSMAATYDIATRRRVALHRHPVLYGSLYGIVLYVVMNHIVVPLSAAGPASTDRVWIALTVVVHMAGVGVPIAFAARRAEYTREARRLVR